MSYAYASGLTREEVERYSRQLVLPDFGPSGQLKLKSSSALVVGAGGLGVPALAYLGAAGLGRLGIVDGGRVELSNLLRQTIYSQADVGAPKAEAAAEAVRLMNPNVRVVPHQTKLVSSNAIAILKEYDVVIDCTDSLPSRYLISDACVLLKKPDVYASASRFDGQATVLCASDGPCYRCLYPEPPPPDSVQDCAASGVLGALPGVLGSLQASQAINLIVGGGDPLVGRLLMYDAKAASFDEIRIGKNPDCPACGPRPTMAGLTDYGEFCGIRTAAGSVPEVDPADLERLLSGGAIVQLLDVREPYESLLCRLPGAKLIPMGELEGKVGELDPSAETVVYCHLGERSARAVGFQIGRGFARARNLKGGIRAWAEKADPDMPVY